jgi:ABC-type uncharacterized transport system substrate-binding protein
VVSALHADLDAICPPACRADLLIDEVDTDAVAQEPEAELLVVIGTPAARRLAALPGETPRLYGFLPRQVWHQLHDCCDVRAGRDSALWIDPPPVQQLRLARQIEPHAARVGVLLGPSTGVTSEDLRSAGRAAGLEMAITRVEDSEQTGSRLRSLIDGADLLLALPDPVIYNRHSIYSILLSTYSARVPVIGYSPAMVSAGAAATLFVSPADAGNAIAQALVRFHADGRLPPAGPGNAFSLSINAKVIRSLGLPDADEPSILKNLQETLQ